MGQPPNKSDYIGRPKDEWESARREWYQKFTGRSPDKINTTMWGRAIAAYNTAVADRLSRSERMISGTKTLDGKTIPDFEIDEQGVGRRIGGLKDHQQWKYAPNTALTDMLLNEAIQGRRPRLEADLYPPAPYKAPADKFNKDGQMVGRRLDSARIWRELWTEMNNDAQVRGLPAGSGIIRDHNNPNSIAIYYEPFVAPRANRRAEQIRYPPNQPYDGLGVYRNWPPSAGAYNIINMRPDFAALIDVPDAQKDRTSDRKRIGNEVPILKNYGRLSNETGKLYGPRGRPYLIEITLVI